MNNKRLYGIDILKCLAMFFVVLHHTLDLGGIISSSTNQFNYYVLSSINIVAYVAVNSFAIISGFVMYNNTPSYRKIIPLWLEVFFYSVIIRIINATFFGYHYSAKNWILSLLPVISNTWWYFSAYFGAFFFFPFINKFISHQNNKTCKRLFIILNIFCSCMTIIPTLSGNVYNLSFGHNFVWLITLYTIGALIKKTEIYKRLHLRFPIIIAFICFIIMICSKFLLEKFYPAFYSNVLIEYTSPIMLLFAISFMLIFSKISIKNKTTQKIISTLSKSSFAVYIIHVLYYKENMFVFVSKYPLTLIILITLGICFIVYFSCTLIELIRQFIFKKLKIIKHIYKFIDKIKLKIQKQ